MKIENSIWEITLDHVFVGCLLFDKASGTVKYANNLAKAILGSVDSKFTVKDLVPKMLTEGRRNFSVDLVELEGVFEDVHIKRGDGTSVVVNICFNQPTSDTLFMMFQDMTFQKKLQREVLTKQEELRNVVEKLEKQNLDLRTLDKAKDRFIGLTSHELRTPISAIVATAQFIKDGLCNDAREMMEHIGVILDEGQHLLEMVNDILDFSKIQMGKLELYVEKINLLEILKRDIENMVKFAATKKMKIVLENPSQECLVYCDPVRMAQVFYNVLSNAIKFSPEKSEVVVKIESKKENIITVSVRDQGFGIPKGQESKVFNEFETIENIRTHHKGTGLGMPICKRIMEHMGGRIYFESEDGKGTVFFIDIPTNKVLAEDVYRQRSQSSDLAA